MEVIGVALAIPGVVELCLKYGTIMCERYQAFHHAEEDIRKSILVLEGHWLQIEAQIKYLQRIWNSLHDRLQIHFSHVLAHLQSLLLKATSMVDGLIASTKVIETATSTVSIRAVMKKEGKLRRGIFALGKKDALDGLITEIRTWHQGMLGPSWFQLLRVPEVFAAEAQQEDLGKSEQITLLQNIHKGIEAAEANSPGQLKDLLLNNVSIADYRVPIFASTATLSNHAIDGAPIVLDHIVLPLGVEALQTKLNFCRLAKKLNTPDTFPIGLLQCLGVLDSNPDTHSHRSLSLLFKLPKGYGSPRSLREILIEKDETIPLDIRLTIAIQLAKAIMSIHSLKVVHKNVQPETIVVLTSEQDRSQATFLVGFEQFRPVDEASMRRGDLNWRKAIYRHPSRHGLHPQAEYSMQHDIYSLGVCLLEIGLWRSFILSPTNGGRPDPLVDTSRMPYKETWRRALLLKENFQHMARQELVGKMGRKYADIVYACLRCLDKDNIDFGDQDEFDDRDDILVSVRYMEKVLLQLQEISI